MKDDSIPIDRLLAGDNDAWTAFLQRFDPVIKSVVAWQKWSFPDALQEDVCQQIRMELPKALPRFKGEAAMQTFIQRICINRCIDEIRYRAPRRKITVELDAVLGENGETQSLELADPSEEISVQIAKEELAEATREALRELGGDCQEMLTDFYLKGLKYKEIAERRGMSLGAVCGKISRCLEAFEKICSKKTVLAEYLQRKPDSPGREA